MQSPRLAFEHVVHSLCLQRRKQTVRSMADPTRKALHGAILALQLLITLFLGAAADGCSLLPASGALHGLTTMREWQQ